MCGVLKGSLSRVLAKVLRDIIPERLPFSPGARAGYDELVGGGADASTRGRARVLAQAPGPAAALSSDRSMVDVDVDYACATTNGTCRYALHGQDWLCEMTNKLSCGCKTRASNGGGDWKYVGSTAGLQGARKALWQGHRHDQRHDHKHGGGQHAHAAHQA